MAKSSRRRYHGTAQNSSTPTYNYEITIPAGETVYVTFEWLAEWDTPVWQASPPASGSATLEVRATAKDLPDSDEQWKPHADYPDEKLSADKGPIGVSEPDPARHFEFKAVGGEIVVNILTSQQLFITSGANLGAALAASGVTLPSEIDPAERTIPT